MDHHPKTQLYFVHGVHMKNPANKLQKELWEIGIGYKNFLTESPVELFGSLKKTVEYLNFEYARCRPERVTWLDFDKETVLISLGEVYRLTVYTVVAKYSSKGGYQLYIDEKGGVGL